MSNSAWSTYSLPAIEREGHRQDELDWQIRRTDYSENFIVRSTIDLNAPAEHDNPLQATASHLCLPSITPASPTSSLGDESATDARLHSTQGDHHHQRVRTPGFHGPQSRVSHDDILFEYMDGPASEDTSQYGGNNNVLVSGPATLKDAKSLSHHTEDSSEVNNSSRYFCNEPDCTAAINDKKFKNRASLR
jgi:hypothetical protein